MSLRVRVVSFVGLILVLPICCEGQARSPLFERALPGAVTAPVSSPSLSELRVSQSQAGRRDSLLNGTVIGAAVGAALGIAFVQATRDSELDASQYAYGALIFGGIGAGVGVGVDALLNRSRGVAAGSDRRVALHTKVSRKTAGLRLVMRW